MSLSEQWHPCASSQAPLLLPEKADIPLTECSRETSQLFVWAPQNHLHNPLQDPQANPWHRSVIVQHRNQLHFWRGGVGKMTLQAHHKLLRLSSGSHTAWIQEVPLSSIFNYVLITIYNRQCVIYGNYLFWRPPLKISDKETDKTWKWAKLTWPACRTTLTSGGEKGMPDKAEREILYRAMNACWQLNQAEEEHNCCGCIPLFVNAYIQYHNNWILCKGVMGNTDYRSG